jgi:formylglycine-generating enzyme required for sulfatase activity
MARHALLIGVARFDDPRLNRLNAPLDDVAKLAELLRDPLRGGFDTVNTVTSGDFQETRNALLTVLLRKPVPDDLILLYYSGHGILAKDGELYLATKAIDMDLPLDGGISAADVRGWLNQSRAGKRIVLLDCCHSGAFPGPRKEATGQPVLQPETFASSAEGQYVLTASDRLQFAYDATAGGTVDGPVTRYSRFTSWLIEAIETGNAAPSVETITVGALRDYVFRRAREEGLGMRPQEFATGEARELIVARNPLVMAAVIPPEIQAKLKADNWEVRIAAAAELIGYLAASNTRRAAAARRVLEQHLDDEWDLRVRPQIERALEARAAPTHDTPPIKDVQPATDAPREQQRALPPPEPTPSLENVPVPRRIGRREAVGGLLGVGAIGGLAYLASERASPPAPSPGSASSSAPVSRPVPASPITGWAARPGQDTAGRFADIHVNGIDQRLRWIQPGQFSMGSPPGEWGRSTSEGPQHDVTLANGFWLFDTPCIQALWEAVMPTNPSKFQGRDRPVERVSFEDVDKFLMRINALVPGLKLELPSEAQWEYAARAGTTAATYCGDLAPDAATQAGVLNLIAWYRGNSGDQTNPVEAKKPNAWGLHDMLGNVYEWCRDVYNDNYLGAPMDGSAWLRPDGDPTVRVVRGGSYNCEARLVRAAYRDHTPPGDRLSNVGFRCVGVPVGD